jgi:hypothetical protein
MDKRWIDEKVKAKHFIFNVSLHKVECGSKGETTQCWDHDKNPKNQFYMHIYRAMLVVEAANKQTKSLR